MYGEGPAIETAAPLSTQGFNEGKGKPFGAADTRFATNGEVLYCMPLGTDAPLSFTRDEKGVQVILPEQKTGNHAYVLKVMS